MISPWWLLAAFIAGGYAGIMVFALMRFTSQDSERAASAKAAGADLAQWLGRDQGQSALQ
jgi:hypothetical protein